MLEARWTFINYSQIYIIFLEVYNMEEVIAYVRQSTLKQQSLATQKSLIIDTAKQYGWSNVTFYDDKKTGRHTKHSGYQKW